MSENELITPFPDVSMPITGTGVAEPFPSIVEVKEEVSRGTKIVLCILAFCCIGGLSLAGFLSLGIPLVIAVCSSLLVAVCGSLFAFVFAFMTVSLTEFLVDYPGYIARESWNGLHRRLLQGSEYVARHLLPSIFARNNQEYGSVRTPLDSTKFPEERISSSSVSQLLVGFDSAVRSFSMSSLDSFSGPVQETVEVFIESASPSCSYNGFFF